MTSIFLIKLLQPMNSSRLSLSWILLPQFGVMVVLISSRYLGFPIRVVQPIQMEVSFEGVNMSSARYLSFNRLIHPEILLKQEEFFVEADILLRLKHSWEIQTLPTTLMDPEESFRENRTVESCNLSRQNRAALQDTCMT